MSAIFQAMRDGVAAIFGAMNQLPASPVVLAVTVTPSGIQLAGGVSQTFSATVVGSNNPPQTVTWKATLGQISATGIFTAPAPTTVTQLVVVTATSTFDPTKSATSTVVVPGVSAPVSVVTGVVVSPTAVSVAGGAQQQFTAVVNGTLSPSQGVTWQASSGQISSFGLFTAPASATSAQSITITATSVQDNTKSATTTLIVAALDVPPSVQQAYLLSVGARGWLSGDYYDLRGRRARIDKVVAERQVYGLDLSEWLAARGTTVISATASATGVVIDSRIYIVGNVIMCWVKGGDPDNLENQEPLPNYLTLHYKCANGTENEYTIWFDVLPL